MAIPGHRTTAEIFGHAFEGNIGVLVEFLRRKNRDGAPTGLKKANILSRRRFAMESEINDARHQRQKAVRVGS